MPRPGGRWHGWITGLPVGIDRIGGGRVMDTAALAAAFPFTSPDLPTPTTTTGTGAGAGRRAVGAGGVLYGHNLGSQSLVFWDRFAADNYNAVILGRSGSGKSYLAKLELLRSLYRGVHAQVIDPEDEYLRLGRRGRRHHRPGGRGRGAAQPLRPADPHRPGHRGPHRRPGRPDAARLFLHTFLAVALHTTPTAHRWRRSSGGGAGVVVDRAGGARPRDHPHLPRRRHHRRPGHLDPARPAAGRPARHPARPRRRPRHRTAAPPAPRSAEPAVSAAGVAAGLAARLRPFVDGAYAGLFDGPTTTAAGGHLVVWSLRALPDELKPAAMLLVLDAIWATVTHPHDRAPRLIIVDEAWLLLAHPAGAQFLLRAAKAGRKHWAGLTVITQDTADVLGDRSRAGGDRQRGHPDPAAPSPPNPRPRRRHLRAVGRGTRVPALGRTRRGAAHLRGAPRRVQRHRLRARGPADHHRPPPTRRRHRQRARTGSSSTT